MSLRLCLLVATFCAWSTSAAAQIVPLGSVPKQNGVAKSSGGPVVNSLPGCGEGGEPEYNFDVPPPPDRKKLGASPGDVDMRAGQLMYSNIDVSIGGTGDGGIALTRSFSYKSPSSYFRQAFGEFFTHNWDIQVQEHRTPRSGACYPSQYNYNESVVFGDLSDTFTKHYNATYFSRTSSAGYAELTGTYNSSGVPNNLVFTARDGTVVTFGYFLSTCGGGIFARCSYAASVKRPDGTIYTLDYDTPPSGYGQRLRSVVSNRGFALVFEYASESAAFQLPSKICALNLSITPKPSNNVCPAEAKSAAYAYNGSVQTSATEMGGGTWTFTQPTTTSFAIKKPADALPYVSSTYSFVQGNLDDEPALVVTSQQMADGRTFTYSWNVLYNNDGQGGTSQQVAGGSWADNSGRTFSAQFGSYYDTIPPPGAVSPTYKATPGPEMITDELGRSTHFDYCSAVAAPGGNCIIPPVKSATDPEGNKEVYTYTYFNNLGQLTKQPKPGSNLSATTEVFNFDLNASPVTRAKPTSTTDARNNTTTYTYDPTHGGVLSETLSADANGAQAVKRYAYGQYYAWLSNGAGGYVAAATPVWLLSQERTCRSSATTAGATGATMGCAGGAADEVVVGYDYGLGDAAHGNNLLLRGKVVTAQDGDGVIKSQRTCFGYDATGNKIWETSARAGLTSCQ